MMKMMKKKMKKERKTRAEEGDDAPRPMVHGRDQKHKTKLFEQSSSSIIIVMTSSRARDAPRRVPLTTTQRWTE